MPLGRLALSGAVRHRIQIERTALGSVIPEGVLSIGLRASPAAYGRAPFVFSSSVQSAPGPGQETPARSAHSTECRGSRCQEPSGANSSIERTACGLGIPEGVLSIGRWIALSGAFGRADRLPRVSLHLFDTATRELREFVPRESRKVGMYICGLTTQGAPHIGHIRFAVAFDVLRRWLETGHDYRVTLSATSPTSTTRCCARQPRPARTGSPSPTATSA